MSAGAETHTPPRAPKVLIVTASVGAGHNSAARAVTAALADAGKLDVQCLDVLDFAPRWFRAYYAGGFALAMTRFPRLYGLGFRLSDYPHGPRRGAMERLRLWREWGVLRRFRRRLVALAPDLVVHTHFLALPIVTGLVRRGLLSAAQMVVVTDVKVHRFWYSAGVERWFVPAAPSADTLRRWGVDESRITVSGIPVKAKWTAPVDRGKVLADWRLTGAGDIVLLSGGTEFTCGPVLRIARGLADACPDARVVVLAGRNKKLLARLARLPAAGRVVGVSFTDRVHELVEVCSLMVTKPGGITTAECLARGTPMVLTNPVPGQEAGNAEYFRGAGAAVIARGTDDIIDRTRRLLADTRALGEMGDAARRLYRPATETIVSAVCQAAWAAPPTEL